MRHARGFTLVELMVTLVVFAILAIIAMPNLTTMIQNNKVTTASNSLLADIDYARTEAVTRGSFVAICPSIDGLNCLPSNDYDQGWIVYVATGIDVAHTSASATPPLRYTTKRANVSIQAIVNNGNIITFGQQGQLDGAQTKVPAGSNLTFATCLVNGSGTAQSTSSVPGIQLKLLGFGSPSTSTMTAGATCTT